MIRLNVFFEVKDAAQTAEIKALCQELVEKSLKDNATLPTTILLAEHARV